MTRADNNNANAKRLELGLYVHIPFCASRCYYCDFPSSAGLPRAWQERYVQALTREFELYSRNIANTGARAGSASDDFAPRAKPGWAWDTVYIGGGTPTYLDEDILEKITRLAQASDTVHAGYSKQSGHIDLSGNRGIREFTVEAYPGIREFTVEANPGTLSAGKLNALRRMGCDRLSIGAQSFDDGVLKTLGRSHNASDFMSGWALGREAGFANMSLDLMYGLAGQSLNHWRETLARAVALKPEHISLYQLNLEPGTKLASLADAGAYEQADEEICRQQYLLAHDVLTDAGFIHYEISNYAKPGYESKHNLRYWRNAHYLGLGAGASGYLPMSPNPSKRRAAYDRACGYGASSSGSLGSVERAMGAPKPARGGGPCDSDARDENPVGFRYSNKPDLFDYIATLEKAEKPIAVSEKIDTRLAMAEEFMLAFRLREGVDLARFYGEWGAELKDIYGAAIDKNLAAGVLEYNETYHEGRVEVRLCPTIEGWLQYNGWIGDFI